MQTTFQNSNENNENEDNTNINQKIQKNVTDLWKLTSQKKELLRKKYNFIDEIFFTWEEEWILIEGKLECLSMVLHLFSSEQLNNTYLLECFYLLLYGSKEKAKTIESYKMNTTLKDASNLFLICLEYITSGFVELFTENKIKNKTLTKQLLISLIEEEKKDNVIAEQKLGLMKKELELKDVEVNEINNKMANEIKIKEIKINEMNNAIDQRNIIINEMKNEIDRRNETNNKMMIEMRDQMNHMKSEIRNEMKSEIRNEMKSEYQTLTDKIDSLTGKVDSLTAVVKQFRSIILRLCQREFANALIYKMQFFDYPTFKSRTEMISAIRKNCSNMYYYGFNQESLEKILKILSKFINNGNIAAHEPEESTKNMNLSNLGFKFTTVVPKTISGFINESLGLEELDLRNKLKDLAIGLNNNGDDFASFIKILEEDYYW